MSQAPLGDHNIASALHRTALRDPTGRALLLPGPRGLDGLRRYQTVTYRELDDEASRLARGLLRAGIAPGDRAALMVTPGLDLFALTFAMFRAGIVPVMIDPGIGISSLGACLAEARPTAFVGVPKAHAARLVLGWARASLRTHVTVGPRMPWGGLTIADVRALGDAPSSLPDVSLGDTAAVLFTSGSTGVPKGAIYSHGNFAAQVEMLREMFAFAPGEIDLPTFPLFALFDPALGMTTVIPHIDFTRPGSVDPIEVLEPARRFDVTNLFGSPALLRAVGRSPLAPYTRLPSVRRVLSAGAAVPAQVIETIVPMLQPGAQVFTPYGATEALPVALVGSDTILGETRALTAEGRGVCVGKPVSGIRLEIIRITDDPIERFSQELVLPRGQVGEIAVQGPNVTAAYLHRDASTRLAKMSDPGGVFHRMGDLGYVDDEGRLWFCGRKGHRVETERGTLFTEQVEGVFDAHPSVRRTALVGVRRGRAVVPVLCVEVVEGCRTPRDALTRELLSLGARHAHTAQIERVLYHPSFPVDIRHNAKIFREKLALWAERHTP